MEMIIISDKESGASIKTDIEQYCTNINSLTVCDSVKSGYRALLETNPSIVLLDLDLTGSESYNMVQMFEESQIKFRLIVISSSPEFALAAYRWNAIQYLLKPLVKEKLIVAVRKAEKEISSERHAQTSALMDSFNTGGKSLSGKLVLSDVKGFTVINHSDIIMLEGNRSYTKIYMINNGFIEGTRNLQFYEEMLSRDLFMRVHNSYVIGIDHVKGYSHQEEIFLSEGKISPLSKSHKPEFMAYFKKFISGKITTKE